MRPKTIFEGQSLSLVRGGKRLFKDLSFSLSPQESLVLIGENGSGKTSLLRLMATLLRPTTGELFWDQKKLTLLDPHLKENIIYVGHAFGLKSNVEVCEMLSFFKDMTDSHTSIKDIAKYWGLEEVKNQKISEISLGCQKKVALSQLNLALSKKPGMKKPYLWVLDEPFTSLDTLSQQKLCELFEAHLKTGGILVFSSHQHQLFQTNFRIHLKKEFSKEFAHA